MDDELKRRLLIYRSRTRMTVDEALEVALKAQRTQAATHPDWQQALAVLAVEQING